MKLTKPFIYLVLAAIFLRAVLFLTFYDTKPSIWDEQEYTQIALNIVNHGTFSSENHKQTAMRAPLYPFFLALVYGIYGSETPDSVRLIQSIISLLSAFVLWHLFRNMFDEITANWGAIIFLFYPSLLFFNCLILTETVFIFFMVCYVYFLSLHFRSKKIWPILLAGICLSLSSLTRSVAYPMLVPFAIIIILLGRGDRIKNVFCVLVMVTLFFLSLSPWILRNYRVFDSFVPIDTLGGLNFFMGNYEHTPLHRAWGAHELKGAKRWSYGHTEEMKSLNEAERQKWAIANSINYISSHPLQTTLRTIVKFANFWGLERTIIAGMHKRIFSAISGKFPKIGISIVILLGYVSIVILGFFGLIWKLKLHRSEMDIIILTLIVCFSGLHAIVFGHSRYHLPLMPFLIGYAAWSIVNMKSLWHEKRTQALRIIYMLVGFFILIWGYGFISGDLHQLSIES